MADTYTLADYQQTATPITQAVIQTWREASPILEKLTFKTSDNLVEKVIRYGTLPTVPWRKIGEPFADLLVHPDSLEERLYFLGAKIDIPYEYTKASNLVNPRTMNEEAIMKGVAYTFNEAFINGSPQADEDGLVGLLYRLRNDFPAAQSIDGGGIDVSPDTALAQWQFKLFDVIDMALDAVDGNNGDKVIFLNTTVYRRFQSAMRTAGLLSTTEDKLGKFWPSYGGAMIVDMGRKVDQTTLMLTDTELANGTADTGATFSSIVVARFGEPYVAGWSQEKPFADDVGLLENRTHFRTVVRGSAGIYISHPRSISRVYNIQVA